jgi:para-nitrobenzyl esterase
MKKTILSIFACLILGVYQTNAQRYLMPVFDSIVITDSIPYGSANNYLGASTTLAMDLYMPYGDTTTNRPLLVLAHGGSFIGGNKKAADIVKVCMEFAKRGYVCASIKYRLGVSTSNPLTLANEFANAVWRGTLDGRGAIRYFYKDASMGNNYKIDTNNIYVGGISAGGVLGLHVAYLDKPSEAGSANPSIDTASIGGVEGSSGNAGYSWKVKGVINLCGAIGTSTWMNDNKNIGIVSVHGTNDNTVPFKTDYFKAGVIPIALLSGSYIVDSVAKANGDPSALKVFYGQDHVPFSLPTPTGIAYMDTTIRFVADFLYKDIKRIPSNGSGLNNRYMDDLDLKVFPVPSKSSITIQFENNQNTNFAFELFNLNGKLLSSQSTISNTLQIERNNLMNGFYILKIKSEKFESFKKIIFE